MSDVQLNVWIEKNYKDQLEHWKQTENKPGMNVIVEELINAEIARRSGKVLEQEALPVIREMVRAEVREATAALRREVRIDRAFEQTTLRDYIRKEFDHLAGLLVHTIRSSGYASHFSYALLSKLVSVEFAQLASDDARKKIANQLQPQKAYESEQEA